MRLKLSSPIHYAIALIETDWRGEAVPTERQTKFAAQVPLDFESSDRQVDLGSFLLGEVPLSDLQAITDRSERLLGVAAAIARSAFDWVARRSEWQVHGLVKTHVSIPVTRIQSNTGDVTCEVDIQDALADILREETATQKQAGEAFRRAKDFLFAALDGSLGGDERRVRSAVHFMCECVRAGSHGYGEGWHDEKTSSQLSAIEDLLRRKNAGHPNYIATASRARSYVYNLSYPDYWNRRPPDPSRLDL